MRRPTADRRSHSSRPGRAPAAPLRLATLVAALLLAPGALADEGNEAAVGFDAGNEGWSINGFGIVTPTGGNPGARIHWDDPVDTFGIAARTSTHAAFLGDYTVKGPAQLSIDIAVDSITFFGSPVPRELVLILYDDDPFMGAPPAQVWTSLGTLDGNGTGWETYSAIAPDVLSGSLPPGWNGAGDEDPVTLEPILPAGRSWTDVLAGVDRVEFTTFVPGFFFGFTNFDLSIDNVTIAPAMGRAWEDLGESLAGAGGAPCLWAEGTLVGGDPVTLHLANAAPSSPAFLFLGLSALNFTPFFGGTLVPDFATPPGQLIVVATGADGALTLGSTWPLGIPTGFEVYLQYWIDDPSGPFGLTASNALKGTTP